MTDDFKILFQAVIDLQKSKNKIDEQIKQLQNEAKIKYGIDIDTKTAKAALKELSQEQKKILEVNKVQLDSRITTYLKNNTKLTTEFKNRLIDLQRQIRNVDKTGLKGLQTEFRKITSEIKAAGLEGKSVFDKFVSDLGNFTTFLSAGTIIMSGVNTVRKTVDTVVELDKVLVDLQMATGGTIEETQQLLDTYIDLGQELGATGTEVARAADVWLRQGKSIAETNELIRYSMILSKDGQIDSAQATEYLTSVMKGYKLEVSDVLSIIDKLSAVDLNSATSVGGLAEAMSRTANGARIAGIEIDKLLGMIAVVGEVSQRSMESVGESFKSIFSRMGNVKAGKFLDENGKDITGEINDVEKVLGKLKIKLRENANDFRNFGDVLDEIGAKWDKFSEVEQNAIATAFAGTYQRESFITLMENYSKSLEYADIAANSAGTAMEKFSAYEESVEAKTKTLQASLQELASDTLNSDIIKGFLDLANVLVNVVDKIGAFNIAILATTGIISGKNLIVLIPTLEKYIYGLATSMGIASSTASTLSATLSTLIPVAAGLLIINTVKVAFDKWNVTVSEVQGKIDKLTSSISSLQSEFDTLSQKQDLTEYEKNRLDYLERRLELDKQILDIETKNLQRNLIGTKVSDYFDDESLAAKKMSESNQHDKSSYRSISYRIGGDLEKFKSIQEEINKLNDIQSKLNLNSTEYKSNQEKINKLTKEQSDLYDNLSKYQDDLVKKQGLFLDYANQADEVITGGLLTGDDLAKAQEMSKYWHGLYDEVSETLNVIGYASSSTMDEITQSSDEVAASFGKTSNIIADNQEAIDNYQKLLKVINDSLNNLSSLSTNDILDLMQEFSDFDWEAYGVTGQKGVGNLSGALKALARQQYETIKSTLGENDALKALYNEAINASSSVLSLSDALSILEKDNQLLKAVKEDIKEIGTISTNTVRDILDTYPELESAVQNYLSGKHDEKELLREMDRAYQTDFKNYRNAVLSKKELDSGFYKDIISELSETVKEQAKNYGINFDNFKNLQEMKLSVYQKFASEVAKVEELLSQNSQTAYEDALIRTTKFVAPLSDIISGLESSIDVKLKLKDYTPSKDKDKKKSTFSDQIDWASASIERLSNKVSDFKDTMRSDDTYEKQISDLNTLIKLQDELINGYNKQANAYKAQYQSAISGLDKKYIKQIESGSTFKVEDFKGLSNGDKEKLFNKITGAQEWYKKWKDALRNASKTAQEQLDNRYKIIELNVEVDSKQIDKVLKKYQKALSLANDKASRSDKGSLEQQQAYAEALKVTGDEVKYFEAQISKLEKAYKKGKVNEEQYRERLEDLTDSLADAKEKMLNYQWSMVESIRDARDQQLDNLKDVLDKELNAIEERYKTEINYVKELTDARIKDLKAQKEADDYNKEISKLTKELSDYDKRIADLSKAANSGDRKAQAELKKLQEERAKAQEKLDEKQADRKLELEIDALEKYADDYEKQANKNKEIEINNAKSVYETKLDNIKSLYAKEEELILNIVDLTKKQFTEAINSINSQLSNISIGNSNASVGNNTKAIIDSYSNLYNASNTSITSAKEAQILSILSNGKGIDYGDGASELNAYVRDNYGKPISNEQALEIAKLLGVSGINSVSDIKGNDANKKKILKKLQDAGFSKGGIVDARSVGEDGFALVKHGEPILTVEQGKMFKELVSNLKPLNNLVKLTTPNVSNIINNNTSNSSPIVNITIPINGNADSSTVRQFQTTANEIAKQIISVSRTK